MTPYQHPTYHAFIDRIRQSPDDDLPRLVAADFLEEQGESDRAAFIRVQVEIARHGGCEITRMDCGKTSKGCQFHRRKDNPLSFEWCQACKRIEELKREEERLHGANYSAHLETLPLISHPTGYHDRIGIYSGNGYVQFVRGFVENIRIRGADWIERHEAILRCNPVRKVAFTAWPHSEVLISHGMIGIIESGLPRGAQTAQEATAALCKGYGAVWPGIEFTFEREADLSWTTQGTAAEAVQRRIGNALAEQRDRRAIEMLLALGYEDS